MLRWRSIVAASRAISRRRLRPLGAGCVTLQQVQNSRHHHQHRSSGALPVPWLLLAGAASVAVAGIHSEGDKSRCHYRRFDDFYKLLEKTSPIGMGAYGTVCAAAHRETGEVVAVKQIPRSAVSAKEVMSEVEILRVAGDHRHIVRLMDLFWDDDLWYVVMEMAHGGELFDRIVNKGLLSEHDTCKVMQDLLHAIEFLHMHNIVHGDIKPENIMIAEDSSTIDVRLGDFGTAFEVMGQKGRGGSADGAKLSGSSRMTVAYSPPEVLDQDGDDDVEVGPKADVWALGVLMYILIAGRHPFDMDPGADEDELQRHICRGEPDFSDPLWSDVSPAAIDLIKRMLSK
ncbi:kinase-like domain-containing protein, partial [Tribonema minus]